MNIFNPEDTNHTLKIVPRYYTENELIVVLKNEATKTETEYEVTPTVLDGYMYISFEHEFINKDNYQVKISESEDIVYRGKIFVTDQYNDTQSYTISKDVFTYE